MDLKITPSGQTIVKPTALGPGANTDTKLLIYGLFQKGRVLAQDGVGVLITEDSSFHWPTKRIHVYSETSRRAGFEFVCVFGHDGNEKKPGPRERPGLSGSM